MEDSDKKPNEQNRPGQAADRGAVNAPKSGAAGSGQAGGNQPPEEEAAPEGGLTVLEMLELLPPQVKEYLLSDEVTNRRAAIYQAFGLKDEEMDTALADELTVFFKGLAPDEFPDRLYDDLGWPEKEEERVAELAGEVMGQLMLPADPFLGDVANALADLGFNPKEFPQTKIKMRRLSYEQAIEEIIGKAELVPDEQAKRRISHALESFLRGVRDEGETEQALTKSRKVGGVGLTEADADAVVALANELRANTVLVEGKPVADIADTAGLGKPDLKRIQQLYVGSDAEQEILSIRRETVLGDQDKLSPDEARERLKEALNPEEGLMPDMWLVVAATLVLAESGGLPEALRTDQDIRGMMIDFMERHGLQKYRKQFADQPDDSTFVNLLLQLLLRQYAGLGLSDSARYGLRVVNILKKQGEDKYSDLVAFDMRDSQFRWIKPEQLG